MGVLCDEDRDFLKCLLDEGFDLMALTDVTWYKFDQATTTVDPVYDDAIAGFDAPVVLKGVCQWDIQEETLSAYGTFERGVEDEDIERPDVIVELQRYDSLGVDRGISNADEFEIKGFRYECIGLHEPDDVLTGDKIVVAFLLQKY